MIYKVEYEGIAYVEAESEDEAKEKWEDEDFISDSCNAVDVTASSGMDMMEDMMSE